MRKAAYSSVVAFAFAGLTLIQAGCSAHSRMETVEVANALADYESRAGRKLAAGRQPLIAERPSSREADSVYLGAFPAFQSNSQPATAVAAPHDPMRFGYWRPNLARQAGGELKQFAKHDGWMAFRDAYWNVDNAMILAGTLGASIAIRESGVDNAVRRRTAGEFKMGDMDETVQILGNPSTHFAAAGLIWVASGASQDLKSHEFSRALGEALIVNGVTTMALKVGTNTRAPDGDNRAWPSGHTSSAFTTAAVINEMYGPEAGLPSLALAGLVGYQRIDSRVHDLSDVVFGAVLGYIVGSSVAREQKGEHPEIWGMKVLPFTDPQTGATGLALLKSW